MTEQTEYPAPPQDVFISVIGTSRAPWEINCAQPAIIKLVEQDIFHGQILDVGCAIGDNAVYIATHANNVHVTGIDLVPKAIEVARKKAEQSDVNIRFECVDMLDNSSSSILTPHSFDIVLDSAVFHAFTNADRPRYLDFLQRMIKPGGLYIQLSKDEEELLGPDPRPRRITKAELFEVFSSTNGWTIESIEKIQFKLQDNSMLGPQFGAYLSLIRRNKTV